MPGVPLDALAQVKRTLRNLFSRRKKKKLQPQAEPSSSTNGPPTQTAIAAPQSPVEAPTTSKRSLFEPEDAPKPGALLSPRPSTVGRTPPAADLLSHQEGEEPPHPPAHPAADPTTATATSLMPDPPPSLHPAPTASSGADDLAAQQPSSPHPHISAPPQLAEAKEIDLNPTAARDSATAEASDAGAAPSSTTTIIIKPPEVKKKTETGMSATSGPMGDHMAEVWRDSDVGVKEGRPGELQEGKVEVGGIPEGEGEGGGKL